MHACIHQIQWLVISAGNNVISSLLMHSVNIPAGHVTHQISNDHYWEMNYSKYCNCTYDPQRYK